MIQINDETKHCNYICYNVDRVLATWTRTYGSGKVHYYCDNCRQVKLDCGIKEDEFKPYDPNI